MYPRPLKRFPSPDCVFPRSFRPSYAAPDAYSSIALNWSDSCAICAMNCCASTPLMPVPHNAFSNAASRTCVFAPKNIGSGSSPRPELTGVSWYPTQHALSFPPEQCPDSVFPPYFAHMYGSQHIPSTPPLHFSRGCPGCPFPVLGGGSPTPGESALSSVAPAISAAASLCFWSYSYFTSHFSFGITGSLLFS